MGGTTPRTNGQRERFPLIRLSAPASAAPATVSSVASGAALLTVGSFVFLASGYIVGVVLARLLGPVEYGRVGVAVAVMTILNTVHSTGLPQAVSRHVAAQSANAAAVLATALRLQTQATVGTAVLLVAAAAALALAGHPLAPYLAAAALTVVPHGLLSLHMAYDNGRHDFRRQALLLVLYSTAKTVLVLVLAVLFRGLGALAGYAAASLGLLLVGRHRTASRERFPAFELIGFAAPVIALVALATTQLNVDLLLVQALGGSAQQIGWYAAVQQVARAPYLALAGLGMALLPVVARREAEAERSALGGTVRQATRYALILLTPAVVVLTVAAPATVELVFGAEYGPGAAALPALMPGVAAVTVFSLLATVLTGVGRPWVPVAIAAAALVVTAIAGVVLIPPFGLVGAGLATSVGGATAVAGVVAALTPMVGPLVVPATLVRIAAAGVAASAVLAVMRPTGLALIAVGGVTVVAYGIALVVLGELDGDDWRRAAALIPRRPGAPRARDT